MKLLAIILFFFPFLAPTPAPVPGTAPEALMTVAMVHAKPGPKALVKVLMGYISAGQVDYNLVCSQSTYPTPVYGDDATLEATDILYTDASGATMYPGQLKGYAFTVSGTGAAQYKLILYDAPDPGVHNYIHTMTACNANTTPTCGGGGNKSLTLPQNSVLLKFC